MYKLKVPSYSDEPVEFYTIQELSKVVGKSGHAIRRLIQRKIIPDANFRTAPAENNSAGHRLYSKDIIVPRLIKSFGKIVHGVKISNDLRLQFKEDFEYERRVLLTKQQ